MKYFLCKFVSCLKTEDLWNIQPTIEQVNWLLQVDTSIHTAVTGNFVVDILQDVAAIKSSMLVVELDLLTARHQRNISWRSQQTSSRHWIIHVNWMTKHGTKLYHGSNDQWPQDKKPSVRLFSEASSARFVGRNSAWWGEVLVSFPELLNNFSKLSKS